MIYTVHPKGNGSWIFIGRTDAESETPILWSPDVKNWLIGKDPDAGKNWRREDKGMTEDEMVGWHHWLNGHEFEYAPDVDDGQGRLACCSPWGHKKSDTTECLNQTELNTVKGFSIVSKAEVDVSLEHRWIINTLKNTQYNLLLEKCTSKLQWNVISHWSEWPSSKDLQTINAGEDVEKRKHSCSVGENVNWYSCYREQNGDFF